jgi:carboxymethylenebutenolidase
MCHEPSSRPPLPPVRGGSGTGERIVLTAADGAEFSAFSARTPTSRGPGVVILPDVRGLHPFYEDLALRFAEAGLHATAIDYFGRTAGIGDRGDDFDHQPHVAQLDDRTVALDVAEGAAHLRSMEGGEASALFTVGFCMGGRLSFNQAAGDRGLAGVIGFYGRVAEEEPGDQTAPIVLAPRFDCPVLGLFGGADPKILPEHVEAFERVLDDAGVPNELVVYEGAPHSFFDRTAAEHQAAATDAWTRILRFIEAAGGGALPGLSPP